MDPRMLQYYNQELQFVRERGAEFAAEYPKIASRLGLDDFECSDPYVERLFESFAFLAARIQLKLDSEFPRFTQHLLEMVFPQYLSPTPSMTVVQFTPDLTEGGLAEGYVLPRHTELLSVLGKSDLTRCTFRTAHEVRLWPLQINSADYFSRDVAALSLPDYPNVKAAMTLRLEVTAGLHFNQIDLDTLPIYIQGTADVPVRIYEQLMSKVVGIAVRTIDADGRGTGQWMTKMDPDCVLPMGFEDDQSLLPYGGRSFQGYRLLDEYFAFPQRYMFAELQGLRPFLKQSASDRIEVVLLMSSGDPLLANRVDESHFSLFCSPAVNLFPKRTDRIHLSQKFAEFHVMPDRTRPIDYEVYDVVDVEGHEPGGASVKRFRPFYSIKDNDPDNREQAFYTVSRRPRVLSEKSRQNGPRSSYVGSECYLALVDGNEAPLTHDLDQLSLDTLCTNRDLPLQMPVGVGQTDFSLLVSAPVKSVRCLAGPTKPKPSRSFEKGQATWRLISHLSLNYLSLADGKDAGAAALRELLGLYCDVQDVTTTKQVDAVRSVVAAPVTRPISTSGPLSFGRGLELSVTLEESGFEGTGAFLLAAVLNEFFAKYVSINSFTETVFLSDQRGEVMRWPVKLGRRQVL